MSETQLFKVGSRVVRVKTNWMGIRPGYVVTVKDFKPSAGRLDLDVMELEEFPGLWFDQKYFEPYDAAPPAVKDGNPKEATSEVGRKDDNGKVRMELLNDMPRAIKGVAEVLHWAVTDKKPTPYVPGSWQHVSDYYARYTGALMRHQNNIATHGQFTKDAETGLLDLKHLACDILILLELTLREQESKA